MTRLSLFLVFVFLTLSGTFAWGETSFSNCMAENRENFSVVFENYLTQFARTSEASIREMPEDIAICLMAAAKNVEALVFQRPGSETYFHYLNQMKERISAERSAHNQIHVRAIEDLVILLQNKWILLNYRELMRHENSSLVMNASIAAGSVLGMVMVAHLTHFKSFQSFSKSSLRSVFFHMIPYMGNIFRAALGVGTSVAVSVSARSQHEGQASLAQGYGRSWVILYDSPMEIVKLVSEAELVSYDNSQFLKGLAKIGASAVIGGGTIFIAQSLLRKVLITFPRLAASTVVTWMGPVGPVFAFAITSAIEFVASHIMDAQKEAELAHELLRTLTDYDLAATPWVNYLTASQVVDAQISKSSHNLEEIFRNLYTAIRSYRNYAVCRSLTTLELEWEWREHRSRQASGRVSIADIQVLAKEQFLTMLDFHLRSGATKIRAFQTETRQTMNRLSGKNEPLLAELIQKLQIIFDHTNRNLNRDEIVRKMEAAVAADVEQLKQLETRLLLNTISIDTQVFRQYKQVLNCR